MNSKKIISCSVKSTHQPSSSQRQLLFAVGAATAAALPTVVQATEQGRSVTAMDQDSPRGYDDLSVNYLTTVTATIALCCPAIIFTIVMISVCIYRCLEKFGCLSSTESKKESELSDKTPLV